MNLNETHLWTALVTPFTDDAKKIDYETLKELFKRQEAAGNGIVIFGSTGESLSLTRDEKIEMLRLALGLNLTVPVMVGVPNTNLADTLDWIGICHRFSIDAFLAATPSYTRPGAEGQIAWFREVINAVHAPLMLYNIPSRTGMALAPQVLENLQSHRNFWAVKESSGGLDRYSEFASAAREVTLFCGDDHLIASAAEVGAKGLVSVLSNIWPQEMAMYVSSCLDKTPYKPEEWAEINRLLSETTNPVPAKTLMQILGTLPSAAVRVPLSLKDLSRCDNLFAANDCVLQWSNDYQEYYAKPVRPENGDGPFSMSSTLPIC